MDRRLGECNNKWIVEASWLPFNFIINFAHIRHCFQHLCTILKINFTQDETFRKIYSSERSYWLRNYAENYTKLHCTLIIFFHILFIKEIFFTAIA